jgi:hypothetical protein
MIPRRKRPTYQTLSEQEILALQVGDEVIIHYWKNNPEDVRIDNLQYTVSAITDECIVLTRTNENDPGDWIITLAIRIEKGQRIPIMEPGGKGRLTIKREHNEKNPSHRTNPR